MLYAKYTEHALDRSTAKYSFKKTIQYVESCETVIQNFLQITLWHLY